jgi:hygromycin-B 4-O-kinase
MKLTSPQVAAFLTEHIGPAVNEVEPLSGGVWSQAFSYVYSGTEHVIRFGLYEDAFLKDEVAANFTVPNLPIPKVTEIGQAFDGYFAISDRMAGHMLDDLDADHMQRVVPSIMAMLDAMREAETPMLQGYGHWNGQGIAPNANWADFLSSVTNDEPGRRIHGWKANLGSAPGGTTGFNQALDQLTKLLHFCPNERHLIHSDLLHYNVLVQDDKISGVIDWANALRGDFLYDVAWFAFWAPWYPAMKGINWADEAKRHYQTIGLDVPHFDERLLCYKLHIGLDSQAYQAYRKDWAQLKSVTDKTLELLW